MMNMSVCAPGTLTRSTVGMVYTTPTVVKAKATDVYVTPVWSVKPKAISVPVIETTINVKPMPINIHATAPTTPKDAYTLKLTTNVYAKTVDQLYCADHPTTSAYARSQTDVAQTMPLLAFMVYQSMMSCTGSTAKLQKINTGAYVRTMDVWLQTTPVDALDQTVRGQYIHVSAN